MIHISIKVKLFGAREESWAECLENLIFHYHSKMKFKIYFIQGNQNLVKLELNENYLTLKIDFH